MNVQADIPPAVDLLRDVSLTEDKIIAAARHCFETAGVPKTRVEDIASQAGVSRQTVYKYFTGKEEIVDRIGHLEMVKVNQIIRARMTREHGFADKITEAIALSIEVSRENPYLMRVVRDSDLMPRYSGNQEALYIWQRTQWHGLIDHARRTSELAEDLHLDQIVQWILMSQLMLMLAYERLSIANDDLRAFVRRFIVEPLLSSHSNSSSGDSLELQRLRAENLALKDIVSQQALELHGMRRAG
jgi:AcrR family transcriptional regulator